MEQPCVKLPAVSVPSLEGWLPAGPALADAQTRSVAGPALTSAGLRVPGGNSSHRPGCPHPARAPAFPVPQPLSTLWMRRTRHTPLSGQGSAPALTARVPGVRVQALDNSWIFVNFFFFLQLFTPQRCQLNLSSQLLELWKSELVD